MSKDNLVIDIIKKFAIILVNATFTWAIFNYVIEYPIEWKVAYGALIIWSIIND